MDDYEALAQELSAVAEKLRLLEQRLAEVERVNARLEEAALNTARGLGEVSRHWDAVYDAMRRVEGDTPTEQTTTRLVRVADKACPIHAPNVLERGDVAMRVDGLASAANPHSCRGS